jgi:glutamyl-tRNA synthetase
MNVLRIEDTDRARYSAEAEREFVEALAWAGVDFDEGPHVGGPHAPYRQSERKETGLYDLWIGKLLDSGHAYKAFDTPEELQEMRDYQQINKQPIGYFGGTWCDAPASKVEEADREGKPHVVRLKMPRGQKIVFQDAIRGRIEWDADELDDPVLRKGDGMPTYHFAAIVDDHLMQITHVIRGEEWISSAPKHVWLIEALGWEQPVWVHCPVIVGKDGKKLSKRHGATSVLDYRAMGFLPEALMNFVALIGWSPGDDREILPGSELIEAFSLDGLQPSPGRFDFEKLLWMNGAYIRSLKKEALTDAVLDYAAHQENVEYWAEFRAEEGDPKPVKAEPTFIPEGVRLLEEAFRKDPGYAAAALQLNRERADSLADFAEACAFFFQEAPPMDEKAVGKWFGQEHVPELFRATLEWLEGRDSVSEHDSEFFLRGYAEKIGLEKLGPVVHPMRVALTGKTIGPGLFELMALLGPEKMRKRLTRALETMEGTSKSA